MIDYRFSKMQNTIKTHSSKLDEIIKNWIGRIKNRWRILYYFFSVDKESSMLHLNTQLSQQNIQPLKDYDY